MMERPGVVKQTHVGELKRLCGDRGYALNHHRKAGPYLTWGADFTERDTPFEELFPSFRILDYRGAMYPQTSFHTLNLGRLKLGSVELKPGAYTLKDLQGIIEQEEQRLQAQVEHFRARQGKGEAIVPELAAERDALEKQVRRTEEVLREPYARLKAVLKVWANETERQLTEGGASGRTEDFYKKARILWRLLTRGVKRDGLDSYLRRELSKFPVPEVVTRSTASALLLIYTSSVHDVIVRTLRMDRKRQFLERVLLHALSDETIPAWSQIKERVEEEAESALNQQSLGPGRPPVIDDLNTYPEVVLRALLEWTDNPANLKKPFRSLNPDNTNTLCGYIRKRLKKHTEQETGHGYAPSQDTIKSQLRSLMGSLGIDLPYGPTNKRSYFEAREEIKDAMEDRFRALP